MNLWKSIEKEPPELNKGVLVTDGKDIYFGRFTSEDIFKGVDSSGYSLVLIFDAVFGGIAEYCYYKGEWSI